MTGAHGGSLECDDAVALEDVVENASARVARRTANKANLVFQLINSRYSRASMVQTWNTGF